MSISETSIHHITKIDIGPITENHVEGVDGKAPYWHRKITITTEEKEIEFTLFTDVDGGLSLHL